MSSTRRASKRARIARRAENDQMRTARRDSLAVLLSRAQRGVPLTADEAALLRAAVEAEIREGDAARQAERGQQRAADRERERVTAAEAAIVEAEERAQEAEAALDRVRALAADMRTWCSPHGIATQYADDIERALAEQPDQAVTVAPGVAVIRDRDAEERAEEAEQRAVIGLASPAPTEGALSYADLCAAYTIATNRADQAEDLLRAAVQASKDAEQRAAQAAADVEHMARRHAEQQQMHDDRRRALADALAVDTATTWPRLLDIARTAAHLAQRAEEAEQRLTRIRDMADAWETRLPATIRTATAAEAVRNAANGDYRPIMFAVTEPQAAEHAEQWRALAIRRRERAEQALAERDRFEAAWQSARQRAAEQRTLADSRRDRLTIRARRITELETRAERAEQRAEWAERHVSSTARALARGDRYRAAWHSARDRARKATLRAELTDAVTAETKRLMERRTTTLRDRAQRAERRIADTRRYVEAAYSADMCEGVREDLRRLLDGQPTTYGAPWDPRPEVITDRATIRDTLAEPEPAEEAKPEPVALATPCAYCAHPRNWHTSKNGPCVFGNDVSRCGCPTFTVTADVDQEQPR